MLSASLNLIGLHIYTKLKLFNSKWRLWKRSEIHYASTEIISGILVATLVFISQTQSIFCHISNYDNVVIRPLLGLGWNPQKIN